MGWEVISGDKRLLPGGGSRNATEVQFDSENPTKKVRFIDGSEPYSFLQHGLENDVFEEGQKVHKYRTINCPKVPSDPNAFCPICDGQNYQSRLRHAKPVFDFSDNSVKMLCGGKQIYEPIAMMHKMGVDLTKTDLIINRSGTSRNDTTYTVINSAGDPNFSVPEGTVIPSAQEVYAPHTPEEMKAMAESIGLKWEDVIALPALQFPKNLQEAMSHVMPNTKYKGQTMETIYNTQKGMLEFLSNSDRVSYEKACAQVILVSLCGANIPGVPNYGTNPSQAPAQTAQQPANTTTQSAPAEQSAGTTSTGTGDRQAVINDINAKMMTKQHFTGDYNNIMAAIKEVSNGKTNITELGDEELKALLALVESK